MTKRRNTSGPTAIESTEPTEADYATAAAWAETATFDPNAPTVLRGEDAAAAGRAFIRSAGPGRPRLDPTSEPGQESPVRRVRLPRSLNTQLDAFVAQRQQHGEKTTPSDVVRDALAEYLKTRQAS